MGLRAEESAMVWGCGRANARRNWGCGLGLREAEAALRWGWGAGMRWGCGRAKNA